MAELQVGGPAGGGDCEDQEGSGNTRWGPYRGRCLLNAATEGHNEWGDPKGRIQCWFGEGGLASRVNTDQAFGQDFGQIRKTCVEAEKNMVITNN